MQQQQQPANMSGTPVIISVQTAPIQTRRRYIPVTSESARQFKRLGVTQVVIGAVCIILQLVSLGCGYWVATISCNGIWIGAQFIVTGVFGIYAGRTGQNCQVVAFHVLSTISACCALVLLCTATVSAVLTAPLPHNYPYSPMSQGIVAAVLEMVLAGLAIAEGVVAIRSSVIGCTIGLCCCKCGGSCCCPADPQYQQLHNLDQPDFTQQQSFASSQQEPTFNTNQEQLAALNQHQQQLMFNQSQKQLALNPNHQPPLFVPSQQQPFNPNQQVPMFNPNLQQPMFNPNQQQLIFLSTQPNVGFYPQHQAVQYYALQPIGSHQTDASTILSEALGQGQNTGPLTDLKATALIDNNNTGTRGDDGSDEGHISSGDVEMLSP